MATVNKVEVRVPTAQKDTKVVFHNFADSDLEGVDEVIKNFFDKVEVGGDNLDWESSIAVTIRKTDNKDHPYEVLQYEIKTTVGSGKKVHRKLGEIKVLAKHENLYGAVDSFKRYVGRTLFRGEGV